MTVTVPCGSNGTLATGNWLGAGDWKNRSVHGPAPHDDTWTLLPDETGRGAPTAPFSCALTGGG